MRDSTDATTRASRREPWNKGKLVGSKPPLGRSGSDQFAPSCKSRGEHAS
jgi:hypothetical protein